MVPTTQLQSAIAYFRIPAGTVDFLMLLYQRALHDLQLDSAFLPVIFPPGDQPAWFLSLQEEERRLIEQVQLYLTEPDAILLYLSFYARLDLGQLERAYEVVVGHWSVDQLAARLVYCWEGVL